MRAGSCQRNSREIGQQPNFVCLVILAIHARHAVACNRLDEVGDGQFRAAARDPFQRLVL